MILPISNNFTADLLGTAPTDSQYFILSMLHSTFFSVSPGAIRGSYIPSNSVGFPSLLARWLMATRWNILLFRTPCIAILIRIGMVGDSETWRLEGKAVC